jgi:heme A synthase
VSAATEIEMSTDRRIGRGWVGLTTVAMWAIFLQSVTAGRIFSGDDWARTAHRTTAGLLFLVVLAAGLAALAVLRERSGGRRLAVVLVALAVCLFVQHGLGTAAADGEDTLWLHVPFGVAIVAFAAQANMLARRLATGASR